MPTRWFMGRLPAGEARDTDIMGNTATDNDPVPAAVMPVFTHILRPWLGKDT